MHILGTNRFTPPKIENVVINHLPPCRSKPVKADTEQRTLFASSGYSPKRLEDEQSFYRFETKWGKWLMT